MISYTKGNILQSPAQVITNPINCVGVMGAGLAAQFKNNYPEMFQDYAQRCSNGDVKPGTPYLFENSEIQILNFPTKRHWRDPSLTEDIEAGLKFLADNYKSMGIYTLALPALGCGLGGLEWNVVKQLIEKHLGNIPDLEVFVYEPDATAKQVPGASEVKSRKPGASDGLAARDI